MRRRNFVAILLLIFIVSVLLVGCKKKETIDNDNELNNDPIEENENDNNEEPSVTFDNTFPLTGIETNDDVDHRPIGVMVNNQVAARPQSGLSQADIVFEILSEGSITRFLALFHSEVPDVVGPVRSAREYYFELARGYDAIYVYHGAADFVNDMIINRGIHHLNGASYDNDGKLFKRESFRKAPHNSYLLFPNAYDVAESKGYEITTNIEPLPFLKDDDQITGEPAQHVKVGYIGKQPLHLVEFTYDQQNEKYNRIEDDQQTKELNSETPIQVDNVFIIETSHKVIDKQGRRAIDLLTSGKALLVQKGKQQTVEWENRDGVIIPVKNGEPIGFVPGKTWVNVVSSIEESVQILDE